MKIWQMTEMDRKNSRDPGTFIRFQETLLRKAIINTSINTLNIRNLIRTLSAEPVRMNISDLRGKSLNLCAATLPDYRMYDWIPIISVRGVRLLINHGCDMSEFVSCDVDRIGPDQYFLHLPLVCYGSAAFHVRPAPLSILGPDNQITYASQPHVTFSALSFDLPPIYRVCEPARNRTLYELFARESFKLLWEQEGFVGAEFKIFWSGS